MKLSINTNYAADSARRHLGMNNFHLKNSMTRLSSGRKIVQPYEDAGGHAVAFKLGSTMGRADKVLQNVSNAISFLEVQDGVLSGVGEIMDRMAELEKPISRCDHERQRQGDLRQGVQGPAGSDVSPLTDKVQWNQLICPIYNS